MYSQAHKRTSNWGGGGVSKIIKTHAFTAISDSALPNKDYLELENKEQRQLYFNPLGGCWRSSSTLMHNARP